MTGRSLGFAALAAALIVLGTGCGKTVVRSGSAPTAAPIETATVGSDVQIPGDDPDPVSSGDDDRALGTAGRNEFVLVLVDQNGGHPAQIPMTVEGPRSGTFVSDASGRVRVAGDPGHYTFKIPVRCYDTIDVQAGGSGRFGIAQDRPGEAEVEVVWRHRFGPSGPVFADVGPYWPVGHDVRLRYDVVDHCRDDARAPDVSLSTYRFRAARNLRVLGTPKLRADGDGFAYVDIRCTADGETELVISDRANPTDALDLVGAEVSSAQRPSCGEA